VSESKRVVSLSPHITEIIYALLAEESLIAVTDFCTFPPEAKNKTSIGGLLNPNLEQLIALQPDILIGSPAHQDLADKLQGRNYKFILMPDRTINDIYGIIDSIGTLLKIQDRANEMVNSIRDSISIYRERSLRLTANPPQAVFLFGGSGRELSVIGSGTFTDDLWRQVGGQNVFTDLQSSFAQINREALLQADPDIIIEFRPELKESNDIILGSRDNWSEFTHLKAVKNNHIYIVTGQYALIPGPRIVSVAKSFEKIIRNYSNTEIGDKDCYTFIQ
jgi:iron complex transport system substrate-binding protein